MFIITSGPVFRFKDKNAWDRWKQKKGIAFRDGPGSESEHTEGERTKREDERENILEVDHGQGEKHSETTKERETQSDDEDAKREARRVQRETQIRRTILDAVREANRKQKSLSGGVMFSESLRSRCMSRLYQRKQEKRDEVFDRNETFGSTELFVESARGGLKEGNRGQVTQEKELPSTGIPNTRGLIGGILPHDAVGRGTGWLAKRAREREEEKKTMRALWQQRALRSEKGRGKGFWSAAMAVYSEERARLQIAAGFASRRTGRKHEVGREGRADPEEYWREAADTYRREKDRALETERQRDTAWERDRRQGLAGDKVLQAYSAWAIESSRFASKTVKRKQ